MNKIFCTFFYNCAPSWTADILICFKIYYDCKICPWPKCGSLNSICKSPFCGLYFVNSVRIEIHWPCTFSVLEAQTRLRDLLLCPFPLSCPLSCSIRVICPIQKFCHASPKETSRRSEQRWQLASRLQLEHTHNPWLLDIFSVDKKASYKTILTSLAGLSEELYNVAALLAMLFLSYGRLQPLCNSWEKGAPDSCPPVQLTPGSTGLNGQQR